MKLKNNNIKLLRIITDINNSIKDEGLNICIFKNISDRLSIGYCYADSIKYQKIKLRGIDVCITKDVYYKDFINSINIDDFTEYVGHDGHKYYTSNYEYEIKQ